jgi:CHAT domain-containing protein/predicted negative regulator of RcsB-dependent stress response
MFFGSSRQFLAFLFVLACALQLPAQTENLSALNVTKKSDAEIQKILENRSETELKEVCDSIIKQDESADFIKDFPARLRAMQLAQTTAQKINYSSGEQQALFRLGAIYSQNNQIQPALEFFNQALAVAEKTGDFKFQAMTLETLAFIYRNQTNYDKALEYCNRAFQLYEKLGDARMTNMLDGIGAIYMYLGDYNQAESAHRRALALNKANKSPEGIANSLFHLAIINRLRGNYADALRLYQEAKQITDALATQKPDIFPSSTIRRHIGGTYFLQGNLRLALDYAGQALALDEKRNDLSGTAYSLQFIAIVRVAEKNFSEAQTLATRTVPMFEKLGDKDGLARSLALLGNIYLSINETEKSLEYFRRALALREASKSRDGMAIARIGIARVFLAQKKYTEALELANKAVESTKETGNRELLWQAQSVVGQIYLAQNDCDKTREAFDAAIGTIEGLRGEVVGGASENSLFFAERIKPYQQIATMLAGQNDFAEAFEYAERAKARVLLDSVRFGRNQPTAIMTAEEQQEENRLRGNVNSLNAQLSRISASDKEKLADLKTKLEAARTDLARFQTNLYATHPELRIKRGAVKPVEISEVGNLLDEKSALLEYTIADDAIFLFVFTKSGGQVEFKTYKIEVKREELTKRIECFRRMLAERNVLFAAESRALYDSLLKPAARQIAGKTNLTIIPQDGLWELPFQALQSAENRYVLDDASVSYSPSLTILRELRNNPRQTDSSAQKTLAFGNPTGGASKINVNLAALPEAEKQTLALKNLYGAANTRVFNRTDANESLLKSETLKGFSILHLATHGVLDNKSPLNSYVLLAPNETTGDDGRLEAWEILEMNLSSDLIFLSACETARGGVRSGEGLVGLAWSLMVAGARNVVVSQWKVESASTTDLTINFYKFLKQDAVKKPDALRQAALKLRRNPATAHPFYWAGFVLIGDAE